MRLKSLHIKGFKSFANDTVLNFSEDVIGVVGPNGSGKSNIVDAIRWVLGEQKNKELRLESMSDIIFNGTKTKKESNAALVELTFDNNKGLLPTEYQTVTISRTLYRSGESEYRLNNVVCRLKDINSLFLDTGIGSNSYAIIALGMVDDILADKDNSRRRMFEQAAGVSKYKVRKRETLNKLKSATDDLNRIDDLMYEIEGNLKALEKQAKKAQKYLDLKQEYKQLSITHAIYSIHELKQKYKNINERLMQLQDEYIAADTSLLTKQAELEKEKKANLDKELVLSDHQKKLNNLVFQIRTKENEKGLLQQKAGFNQQNRDQLTKTIAQNDQELSRVSEEAVSLSDRIHTETMTLEEIRTQVEASRTVYENIKAEYNTAKLSFDTRQKQKQALEYKIFEAEKQLAIFINTIENNEREIFRIQENMASKEKEVSRLTTDLDRIATDVQTKTQALQALLDSEEQRKLSITETETRRDKLQEELNKLNRQIDSKQNEYDLLKSMIDNFEGFPESIKFLNEQWKKDLVILSDILDVQDNYKAPIELYLEQFLNYFIVSDAKEAIQGISILKNAQKGKANFFLLSQIPFIRRKSTEIKGLVKATDVVTCPDKYHILIQNLLADVYIYNGDIDQYPGHQEDITVIAASGTFLKQGYTISGGSVGLFEGKKIGRKQNLEKLASFLDENHKIKAEYTAQLDDTRKILDNLKTSDYSGLIDKHTKEIQSIEQNRIRLQHQLTTLSQFKDESEIKIKASKEIIKEQKQKIATSQEQISMLRQTIADLEKPDEHGNHDVDTLSDKMSSASEQYNKDNILFIRQQNLISNFVKDKEFKDLKISELTLRITNDKQRLLSEEKEKIDIEDQVIALDRELKDLYVERRNFQSNLSDAEQSFLKARNYIAEIDDSIRELTKLQTQRQHTIQNLKDQFSDQKFQIQSIGERLRIEFQIAINDIINQTPDPDTDFEELNENLDRVKSRLHGYGDVNPLAVEAYNEMKGRYDNMQVQRQDILEAKESLNETIKEIEKTATHQFMDAFENIRENFIDVFRSLFTEDDTCDLILLSPDNPLESDIEIIAKPKGKKPKSLSQLSGGEKTLTATALLFALYLLKPAPFCIFDEVDAPLDDANIQKFNRIIQKFSKKSQFIIVTHNKSTMAEVDILYGVYMVEPGVSAVSAVDFRSLKHDPILESLN